MLEFHQNEESSRQGSTCGVDDLEAFLEHAEFWSFRPDCGITDGKMESGAAKQVSAGLTAIPVCLDGRLIELRATSAGGGSGFDGIETGLAASWLLAREAARRQQNEHTSTIASGQA